VGVWVEILDPPRRADGTMVIRIEGEETINGKKYYRQVTEMDGVPGQNRRSITIEGPKRAYTRSIRQAPTGRIYS
jgi:hypothetical protein